MASKTETTISPEQREQIMAEARAAFEAEQAAAVRAALRSEIQGLASGETLGSYLTGATLDSVAAITTFTLAHIGALGDAKLRRSHYDGVVMACKDARWPVPGAKLCKACADVYEADNDRATFLATIIGAGALSGDMIREAARRAVNNLVVLNAE